MISATLCLVDISLWMLAEARSVGTSPPHIRSSGARLLCPLIEINAPAAVLWLAPSLAPRGLVGGRFPDMRTLSGLSEACLWK